LILSIYKKTTLADNIHCPNVLFSKKTTRPSRYLVLTTMTPLI